MWTAPITPEKLASSVFAVPPLARDARGIVSPTENAKQIRHLEAGGVYNILYGGNAVFYHLRLSEYAHTLNTLVENSSVSTLITPSVGPSFGLMMDQAVVLKDFSFPSVMILPQKEIADENGIATGIRRFAEKFGKPIVLYLKHNRWLSPLIVQKLVGDSLVSWIKYAVVLDDPNDDPYLKEILGLVPNNIMVSGIGEQPAIIHMRDFGMTSYTSGCVCVAPKLSADMLRATQAKDYAKAETIRGVFRPLEDLRNGINPIRVLHHAVGAAGICETGPMQPMLGELTSSQQSEVAQAAKALLSKNP
jgi:dihydrodipicolinate synthase/N-acetylneuraminate lyase